MVGASSLLREWGNFMPPPVVELVLPSATLRGSCGPDISEVSFQAFTSELTRAQADRIPPTSNYSWQPVHLFCHLTSFPFLSRRQRCFRQRRDAVRPRLRCLCPLVILSQAPQSGGKGIKPLGPHPPSPTDFLGSTQGILTSTQCRMLGLQDTAGKERENKCVLNRDLEY